MTTTVVYVSTAYGQDIIGNGTFLAPYKTIAYAMGQITPSSGTPFEIYIGAEVYSESSLALKPYTNLIGNDAVNAVVTIGAGNITLDASWAGQTSTVVIQNITFGVSTGIDFDFTSITGGAAVIDLTNVAVDATTVLNGRPSLADTFNISNCLFDGNFTGQSATFAVTNGTNFANTTTMFGTTGSSANIVVTANNCLFNCITLNLQTSGANTNATTITNSQNAITNFNITTSNTTLHIDSVSYSGITFSGGATFSANVVLLKESHSMFSNFTPVKYTPVDTSVTGNLHGIDNYLGTVPTNPVSPTNGGTGVSNPTAHTLPVAEGSSNFNFLGPLTNGQLLIGSTGADPTPAALTQGTNIVVTNGAGSITVATSTTPTFASATLTNTTNQLVLGTTNTTTLSSVAPSASRTYSIQDAGGAADVLTTLYPGTNSVTWTTTPITFNSSGSSAMNIGTGSYSGTLTLGNASATINNLGTFNINNTGSDNTNINTVGGTLTIGGGSTFVSNAGNVSLLSTAAPGGNFSLLASTSSTNTMTFGNDTGPTVFNTHGTININTSGSSAVNIGTNSYSGTMTVGNSSATLQVGSTITSPSATNLSITCATGQSVVVGPSVTVLINTTGGNVNIGGNSGTGLILLGNPGGPSTLKISGTVEAVSAGGTTLGTAVLPFGGLILGNAATNVYTISPATAAAARTYTIIDAKAAANFALSSRSTISQTTSITTGVTITGPTGTITTVSLSTGTSTVAGAFVVTNTFYSSSSQVITATASYGGATTGMPYVFVSATAPGSNTFTLTVANISTGSALNGTLNIYFTID